MIKDIVIAVDPVLFDFYMGKDTIDKIINEEFPEQNTGCVRLMAFRGFKTGSYGGVACVPDPEEVKAADRYMELYFTHPEINGQRRALLDSIGSGRALYALWSTHDIRVEEKLERSGLKSYFEKCFVCDSFTQTWEGEYMKVAYFKNVIKKEICEFRSEPEVPIKLICGESDVYKKGKFQDIVYYDPHKRIRYELNFGYDVNSYDELISYFK